MAEPTASSPFDKADADIILRSSDNVDFYVYKVVLRLASPFFEDMFTLPQNSCPEGQDTHPHSGLPLVHVTENSQTLDSLLRLCYPVADPVLSKLADVQAVLSAALKYQMDEATALMKTYLSSHVRNKPLSVYAIACSLGLEENARAAAEVFCNDPMIDSYDPAMDEVSSGAYYRLLQFRRRRALSPFFFAMIPGGHTFCNISSTRCTVQKAGPKSEEERTHITSFLRLFDGLLPKDIILRSSEGVEFHVSQCIISATSTIIPTATEIENIGEEGIRAFTLAEDGYTLSQLLQFSYPTPDPNIGDFDNLAVVLEAAAKYKIARGIAFARKALMEHVPTYPLRVYFISMRHKWRSEAEKAAKHIVVEPKDVYVPEMEEVSAAAYRRLLVYRQRCHSAVAHFSEKFTETSSSGRAREVYWTESGLEYNTAHDRFCFDLLKAVFSTSTVTHPYMILVSARLYHIRRADRSYTQLNSFLEDCQRLETDLRRVLSEIEF
ncbi:hypothetical protein AcW1_002016 [Taiwanofungus camphoratus]|nr:hypothetical protein AcW1_002016 [Antrodia cinnamomea]KAI0945907.1 hypothetical protein AcV7_010021 [Antrodia cinnamomea]